MNRIDDSPKVIAISGAAGNLGRMLIRKLHRVNPIIAIDSRAQNNLPNDVSIITKELANRGVRNTFRQKNIDTVIHLETKTETSNRAPDLFTRSIKNYSKLLEYCDSYHVKKLILLSSADLYGAQPSNSQFLTEESPLLSPDMSVLRDVDMMTQSFFWKHPETETVILRPAHIMGSVNGLLSNYLTLKKVPVILGFDPMLQIIHEEDVVNAIFLSLENGVRGIFNIAGPKPVKLRKILNLLNRQTVEIPHILAPPILRHMNKMNLSRNLNPTHINYLKYICMVDDSRARKELNYTHLKNLDETIKAFDLWK
ncbi:MAG: NAD-dependent epimerase/dehydratase family protein [Deltaproteobacteria bacterium]|nr:NAD-dependent epimerase/dehydratase family protein [Deltaproteobacteria bacterium]